MAYSSKSEAIATLTNGFTDSTSSAIYPSNTSFNSSTIFYTDQAKTVLLPSGSYVFPTNYRTLWVSVGNDGKFNSTPEFLFTTASDTSWVEYKVFSQQTDEREQPVPYVVTLTGSLLTNSYYIDNPGSTARQWVTNMSNWSTSQLVNLDLSEMAGYDILFYFGEYDEYHRFNNYYDSTFFVHIKQNLDRQTISTEDIYTKNYFFRPDYWYATSSINQTTFFKRGLFLTPIENKKGVKKYNLINDLYVHDVLQYDKTTVRTSTRKQRGVDIELYSTDTKYNTTYYLNGSPNAYQYTNTAYTLVPEAGIIQDQPNALIYTFAAAWGYPYVVANMQHQVNLTATLRSMYLGVFSGTFTYTEPGTGTVYTADYAQANPYEWRCTYGSGNGSPDQLTNLFVSDLSNSKKVSNWFWDFEWYTVLNSDENGMRGVFECYKNAKAYVVSHSLSDIDTKITWYAGGVYTQQNNFVKNNSGVNYTTSSYTTSPMYSDYDNYYISGANKSVLENRYWAAGLDYIEYFSHSFVSNYLNDYNEYYYFYKLCHQHDISDKLIIGQLGSNHQIPIASFIFNVYETILGSSMQAKLKAFRDTGDVAPAKPDVSPDFWQSLAAWSFGFADGCFNWDTPTWWLEYYSDLYFPLYYPGTTTPYPPESFKNDFAGLDWFYCTIAHMYQNKDIIEANTDWFYVPQDKGGGVFTSGQENYPFTLSIYQRPLVAAKFSADGTEALVLALNPFNNGYTKSTVNVQVVNGHTMSIDMWGTYTTIMRVKINI